MKVFNFVEKAIAAGLLPTDGEQAKEALLQAAFDADVEAEQLLDPESELLDQDAAALWQQLGGQGSPNVTRPTNTMTKLCTTVPRLVGDSAALPNSADGVIPASVELVLAGFANMAVQEVAPEILQILDGLKDYARLRAESLVAIARQHIDAQIDAVVISAQDQA